MRIESFVDEGLGHSSYLVDLGDGTAALLDPPRLPTAQLEAAQRRGLRVAWTIDTHSHADYVTGSPGLVATSGAVFVAPEASRLATPHRAVADGDRVRLAPDVALIAIATPGHTPDHHAYLLDVDGRVEALFSGGSLMVGAVGRTDLMGAELAEPLAHEMFRSLRRFDALPDDLAVLPTHGAGSFCSAPGGDRRTTTLGHERATNALLRIAEEDAFVEALVSGFGTFPSYFARLPEVNRLGPHRYDAIPQLSELSPEEVEIAAADGAAIVDVRSIAAFAAGHVPGSLSNQLRAVFGTWIGWLVEPGCPIVFVGDDTTDLDDAVRQCLDVGHEHFAGRLRGGIDAWRASGRPIASIPLVGADTMREFVVDVRQADEFRRGHVLGAVNVELAMTRAHEFSNEPLSVMCGHGERAMTAASMLAARDYDIDVLDGGPADWASATGRALVSDA